MIWLAIGFVLLVLICAGIDQQKGKHEYRDETSSARKSRTSRGYWD
jgi:hypothetical protein